VVEEIFSSQARVAIMNLFLMNPDDRYYLRQVASLTSQPVRAVEREVAKLEAVGLLTHSFEGNRKYYRINRDCPIFPELKSIFLKTVSLGDALRGYLDQAATAIEVAFIYGSYARGEETTTSDIDLFVIGSITTKELSGVLARVRRDLGREINPMTMTLAEFQAKVKAKNHFVVSILNEPKVFLVGDERDLESIARRRETKKA